MKNINKTEMDVIRIEEGKKKVAADRLRGVIFNDDGFITLQRLT